MAIKTLSVFIFVPVEQHTNNRVIRFKQLKR